MTFGAPDGGAGSGGHHGVDSRHESPMTPSKAGSGVVTVRKLPAADHHRRRRCSVRRSTDGSRWNSRFRSLRRSRRWRRSRDNGATVGAPGAPVSTAGAAATGAKPSYSSSSSRRRRPAAITNQPPMTPTRPSALSRPMSAVEKANAGPEDFDGAREVPTDAGVTTRSVGGLDATVVSGVVVGVVTGASGLAGLEPLVPNDRLTNASVVVVVGFVTGAGGVIVAGAPPVVGVVTIAAAGSDDATAARRTIARTPMTRGTLRSDGAVVQRAGCFEFTPSHRPQAPRPCARLRPSVVPFHRGHPLEPKLPNPPASPPNPPTRTKCAHCGARFWHEFAAVQGLVGGQGWGWAPRSKRPGSSPVWRPSSKVTVPALTVAR